MIIEKSGQKIFAAFPSNGRSDQVCATLWRPEGLTIIASDFTARVGEYPIGANKRCGKLIAYLGLVLADGTVFEGAQHQSCPLCELKCAQRENFIVTNAAIAKTLELY